MVTGLREKQSAGKERVLGEPPPSKKNNRKGRRAVRTRGTMPDREGKAWGKVSFAGYSAAELAQHNRERYRRSESRGKPNMLRINLTAIL